jgi:membrane carboxypeptidase/penicillin-binding protein
MSQAAIIIRRRRRRLARRAASAHQRRLWTGFFAALLLIGVVLPSGIVLGGTALIYSDSAALLPAPPSAPLSMSGGAARFYDASGTIEVYMARDPLGERRAWVTLEALPAYVVDATLIVEDPDFWSATRSDAFDLLVRLWRSLLIGAPPPDPSITGRLVRNVAAAGLNSPFAQTTRAWWAALLDRRTESAVREIALVAEANRRYTPAEILEWHLNTNDYGSEAYGIEAAAQIYFGKPAAALTLDEAALLASIPTAPQYNPFDNPAAAQARGRDALRALYAAGLIGQADYESALARQTPIQPGGLRPEIAPDYILYARRQAEAILSDLGYDGAAAIARGGLRIVTALDLDLQRASECILAAHLARLSRAPDPPNCPAAAYLPPLEPFQAAAAPIGAALPPDTGTLAIIDARTGALRSMVGAAGAAAHQPGITLQPFVYLEGFSEGLTAASMVLDIPLQFPGARDGLIYTPSNVDGLYRGPINLRDAMGAGLLPPAAAIAHRQGMSSVIETAHLLGVNGLTDGIGDLMLLERGGRVSVLDIATAYSVFAGMGRLRGAPIEPIGRGFRGRDPAAVIRIETADGAPIWAYDLDDAAQCRTLSFCTNLLQDGLAYLINDILSDQTTRWTTLGQGSPLELTRPAAVVSGVTSDRVDNWTVGYTPQLVTAVHLGRTDGAPLALDRYGVSGAAAVWRAVMEYAHARDGLPAAGWARPPSIVESFVCERSGMYPNAICPIRQEIFIDGTQPRPSMVDTYWQEHEINRQTRLLATASTPPELRVTARYFVPPPEALAWWRQTGQPLPPTEIDTLTSAGALDATRITAPAPFSYVGGVVQVLGAVDLVNLQFFQLAYGAGLNPAAWTNLSGQQTRFQPGVPLAVWDTTGLDGLYSLRLTLVRMDNSVERRIVQVTVDNQPPQVSLNTDPPARLYRFPDDSRIALIAEARDNLAVDRVEFYHAGALLGADETAPYGFTYPISGVGRHEFRAVAFDAVGNQAESLLTVEVIRSG